MKKEEIKSLHDEPFSLLVLNKQNMKLNIWMMDDSLSKSTVPTGFVITCVLSGRFPWLTHLMIRSMKSIQIKATWIWGTWKRSEGEVVPGVWIWTLFDRVRHAHGTVQTIYTMTAYKVQSLLYPCMSQVLITSKNLGDQSILLVEHTLALTIPLPQNP